MYIIIIAEREARRIIVLPDSGPCRYIYMSATDVGWAPPGGVKDNKEENDALAWKAWPLQLEQETSAEPRDRATDGRLGSLISRGHS